MSNVLLDILDLVRLLPNREIVITAKLPESKLLNNLKFSLEILAL